jgi:hypothetical protein
VEVPCVRALRAVPPDLEDGPVERWAEFLGGMTLMLEAEIERLGHRRAGPMKWQRVDLPSDSRTIWYEFRMPHTPILGPHPTTLRLARER